jgi:hypothetical protein
MTGSPWLMAALGGWLGWSLLSGGKKKTGSEQG